LLELVHSDVCGPLKVKSFTGALYFITFIDDCSRKLWVYALKTKDQVLEKLKEFHVLVERQSGKKLKCIRTDNGGEYCGSFDVYCKKYGIKHEKTPPKTPQLNGLAERMNITLIERIRCMLSEAKLPKHFWGEELYTAMHVIMSPAVALNGEVSDNIWFGKNVRYDHLRVFGCKAYVHVQKNERSKLDAKTRQCIFIGYVLDECGYKFFDPVERKSIRSRDVKFIEDQTIEDIDKIKKTTSKIDNRLSNVDPVRMPLRDLDTIENNVQNDEQHDDLYDQQLGDNFDVPIDVPYASALGSLMYAMVSTRPDITHVVGTVSRFLSNPGREHWNAVKWILRYLRGTTCLKLCFGGDKLTLVGYIDFDMVGDRDSRRSTSGYVIKFAGGVVAWQSRLQKCVAFSTTKAEFIIITKACKELLWVKKFLQELSFVQDKYLLFCDSQSAIHLGKCTALVVGSNDVASSYCIGVLDETPGWQKGRKSGGSCSRQLLSWRAPISSVPEPAVTGLKMKSPECESRRPSD